jgi:hypothetical protein
MYSDPELLLSGATSFDGSDDYIQLASDGRTDFANQSFTISAWIKPSTVASDNTIFSYDFTSHANPYYAMHLRTMSSGRITLNYNNGSGSNDGTTSGNNAITAGVWQHVSATYTSGTQKIYVNGSVVASGTHSHTITFYDQEVWIGKANFSGSEFNGSIANVGIWNRALSSSEIESIYWKGQYADLKGTELTNLVSWYNLKDTGYGSELVTNGDFSTLSEETTIVQSGSSQKIFMGSSGNNGLNQNITSVAGATYEFTAKIYVTGGKARIIFDNGTDDGEIYVGVGGTSGYTDLNVWHTVSFTKTAQGTILTARLWTNSANTTLFADDVSIKEVIAPDSTGTNNGSIYGATTLTDAYSASSPFLPRIQDKASDTVANYGEVYGGNAVSFDGIYRFRWI